MRSSADYDLCVSVLCSRSLTLLLFVVIASQTGFSFTLTHLDDHKFTINVSDVTECDYVMRVPGKGMPRRNGRGHGDLYLTFEVDFPDELSDAQKKAIREILTTDESKSEL